MCIPVAGLHIWFLLHGISRSFHFIARHFVWWLNGSLFLLTQLHHSGLCKLPWLCLKSWKWANCLCFRAIRKWEPYGGSLASVGRTTYPKGRMYIPFSWNKWVQSKHLLNDFGTLIFGPTSHLFILFHPILIYSWYGMWGEVSPSPRWSSIIAALPFWNAGRMGLSPPIPAHISCQLASSRRSLCPTWRNELKNEFCVKDRSSAEGPE